MVTEKRSRQSRLDAEQVVTEEVAAIAAEIEQLQTRLDRLCGTHPTTCRCAFCGNTDPDLNRNLHGLAIALRAFGSLIDMDRPKSITEIKRQWDQISKGVEAAGSVEKYLASR